MATQEQVDDLQTALIAAEKAWKTASDAIIQAANNEVGLNGSSVHGLEGLQIAGRKIMSRFHKQAELCSLEVGVTPKSSPGEKDDD